MKINIEGTPEEIRSLQQMTQPKPEDIRCPVLVRDLGLFTLGFDAVICESVADPRRHYTAAEARDMEVLAIQGIDPMSPGRRDHLLVILVKDPEDIRCPVLVKDPEDAKK